MSDKEPQKREKALRKELQLQYKRLLDENVAYIITPEEREAFLHLSTDEEREQFIEQFWLRRDPTPDTVENEYKGEALPPESPTPTSGSVPASLSG